MTTEINAVTIHIPVTIAPFGKRRGGRKPASHARRRGFAGRVHRARLPSVPRTCARLRESASRGGEA